MLQHAGAALDGGDARTDVLGLAGRRLGHPVGVGQQPAAERHAVALPGRDRRLGDWPAGVKRPTAITGTSTACLMNAALSRKVASASSSNGIVYGTEP